MTAEQIFYHFSLERELAVELLRSSPEERWSIFQRCYNELYVKLPWLAGTGNEPNYAMWKALIGPPGSKVFEVGSGAGRLANQLAAEGYDVVATDISSERGERTSRPNLRWEITDGVNLARFAARGAFDAVISNQVIEHLHPDDVVLHFCSARELLRSGGRYIFETPHRLTGPYDVSKVFGWSTAVGMHLREYTNSELVTALRSAGFSHITSVLRIRRIGLEATESRVQLGIQLAVESMLGHVGYARAKALARRLPPGPLRLRIILVARK